MPPVEVDMAVFETELNGVKTDIAEIKGDLRALAKSLSGRPSWTVSALITLLTTAVGILATLVATLR